MPQMNKGSKVTGGFCVTRKGEFSKYKRRSYCWINISKYGMIQLHQQILDFLHHSYSGTE